MRSGGLRGMCGMCGLRGRAPCWCECGNARRDVDASCGVGGAHEIVEIDSKNELGTRAARLAT